MLPLLVTGLHHLHWANMYSIDTDHFRWSNYYLSLIWKYISNYFCNGIWRHISKKQIMTSCSLRWATNTCKYNMFINVNVNDRSRYETLKLDSPSLSIYTTIYVNTIHRYCLSVSYRRNARQKCGSCKPFASVPRGHSSCLHRREHILQSTLSSVHNVYTIRHPFANI